MGDDIFAGSTGVKLVQQKFVAFAQQYYPHCRITANKRTELMSVEMCSGNGPVPEKLVAILSKANEIIAAIQEMNEEWQVADLIFAELNVGKISVGYKRGELVFFVKLDVSVDEAASFVNGLKKDVESYMTQLMRMEPVKVVSYESISIKKKRRH